jgi:hypothetical protein
MMRKPRAQITDDDDYTTKILLNEERRTDFMFCKAFGWQNFSQLWDLVMVRLV